jgi:SAM-dependent methyltransferase
VSNGRSGWAGWSGRSGVAMPANRQNRDIEGYDKFAGRDQRYLREVQYVDPANLTARANLHVRYGTATEAWFPWLAAQIDWPASAEVLEVGCGPGWMWVQAADELPVDLSLTLTDLSAGMVQAASGRVAALQKFVAIKAQVADAQRLPFADASFDVVVANHMLYHAPDPAAAVSELARVLKPDACLLAAANGPANLRELWEIRAQIFGGEYESGTTHRFGSVTGLPMLTARFAEVQWRSYVDQLRCTDPDAVIAYFTSCPPGEDASPPVLAALDQAIRARFDNPDGVFTITKDAGAFIASRPLR